MQVIVVTDDELKGLEKRFGPAVRHMGPWSSDGTFGYTSIPMVAVEKAAEALENPDLAVALSLLDRTSPRTKSFVELLETFGPALIESIVVAYKEYSLEMIGGTRPASKQLETETGRISIAIAGA
jgi:hypothetical protein